jgi:hypothetical protein
VVESAIPKIILTCQNEQQGVKMNGTQAAIPSELLRLNSNGHGH